MVTADAGTGVVVQVETEASLPDACSNNFVSAKYQSHACRIQVNGIKPGVHTDPNAFGFDHIVRVEMP